jgi:hypothetical protein
VPSAIHQAIERVIIMNFRTLLAVLVGSAALAGGCTQRVTNDDVEAARKKADQERQEAITARGQSPDKQAAENSEARKAEADLRETEVKAAATKQRDDYVASVDARLTGADQRIDALESAAKDQTGATKDATDKQIADIKARRDRLKDGVSTLKSADLLQWDKQRENVDRLLAELDAAIK